MGLQFEKTLDTGMVAEYWKITQLFVDLINQEATVYMFLYKDQTARQAGKKHIQVYPYQLGGDFYPFTIANLDTKNPVKAAYDQLKVLKNIDLDPGWSDPETEDDLIFQGAIDV